MGWFRRNIRVTTSFALLVLAIHFALTFGHPHVESLINRAISILSGPGSADSSIEALPPVDGTSHGPPRVRQKARTLITVPYAQTST
jgi:hypothetical protein